MTQSTNDFIVETARAAPGITVTGLTLFGVQLSDIVLLATLVYTAAQLFFLIRDKWYIPRKHKRSDYGRR